MIPAVVQLTEQPRLGRTNIGQEDFVEVAATVNLVNRTNFNTRSLHVNDEHRNSGVLWRIGIGTSNHDSVIADVSKRGPNFLTIEHPLITIKLGLGLQTGNV